MNKSNQSPSQSAITVDGVLVDELRLTIDELARACAVERTWIVARVSDCFLYAEASESKLQAEWRFASCDLQRAKRLVMIERDFDANPELAALVVDLMEELAATRRQLTHQ